jgi:hypothetical protein
MGILKFLELGLLQVWGPVTLCANLWSRWGLKQSCSAHQKVSNNMSHATCTQGNWVDSQLLMIRSEIANLTLGLSFGHNLCFKYPNGSCEPNLDIYVSIVFQWYKEFFKLMGFNPYNCLLKIWESIGTPTFKMGVHLGVWRFISPHYFAFLGVWDVTPRVPSWPKTLQTFALVVTFIARIQRLESWTINSLN